MPPVKSAAMIAVAATTPGNGRPALERMTALTTRMYDMTRKLVSPPRTSVPIVEPASVTLKYESNQLRCAGIAAVRGAMQTLLYPVATPATERGAKRGLLRDLGADATRCAQRCLWL